MDKIRLLNFVSNYKVGLTQALTEQTEELVKEQTITLFNLSSENEQEEGLFKRLSECKAHVNIISGLDDHSDFKRLVKEVAEKIDEYEITHVNVHSNWQLAILAYIKTFKKSKRNFKLIYTIHGYRHNSSVKSVIAITVIGNALKIFADRVISMSSYVSRKFPMVANKTDLVYYMMKGPQYELDISPVNGSPIRMVFPAQFRHGKQQDILIKAVQLYINETGDDSIQLILPGQGPLRQNMVDLAQKYGIDNNVLFPGQLKLQEVAKLYLKCNIALCSSNVETYGRCIAEPYMLGRCVITQKTGVAEDIIEHGKNGMFFKTAEDLADILVTFHKNPNLITDISSNALKNRGIFSRERVLASYLESLAKA